MLIFSLFLAAASAAVPFRLEPGFIDTREEHGSIAQNFNANANKINTKVAAAVVATSTVAVAATIPTVAVANNKILTRITIDGVPVDVPQDVDAVKVRSFPALLAWIAQMKKSLQLQRDDPSHRFHNEPYQLHSVAVLSTDMFGPRIGFMRIQADVRNSEDPKSALPGIALLRGASVGMLVILTPDDVAEDANERYAFLTIQPRIPGGSLAFAELPAGMADEEGNLKFVAVKELKEELGLTFNTQQLISLGEFAEQASKSNTSALSEDLPFAMFPSVGGSDEYVQLFATEIQVTRKQITEWNGKYTGEAQEGEKITTKIVHLDDMWKVAVRDSKALVAKFLWDQYEAQRKANAVQQHRLNATSATCTNISRNLTACA